MLTSLPDLDSRLCVSCCGDARVAVSLAEALPTDRSAIVVLSGYVQEREGLASEIQLGEDAIYRCLTAIRLHRSADPCVVIVTGGKVYPSQPGPVVAVAMGDFLAEYGIERKWLVIEQDSRSTYENAVATARLLQQRNLHQVLLVTDAIHLPRAERCFRGQGIQVTPIGSRYRTAHFGWSVWSFLPSPTAIADIHAVTHEWLGLLWYSVNGRI